ncbi:DUF541 domain-containing protein [Silvanigrella paludirubra]|jgi:hypothetical protein|uniref:DUF541 domain-containing protein n=1 Tax=Silvanigrella paludirubra TaxID=2499159 RepID=A0A6N6VZU5_9BACT|nr:SIMPL domain-containing protein [Silvanigrella paludirubra]KAB8040896.1 DUF541 domain-containing protein [Silvanigrella paludirubra]
MKNTVISSVIITIGVIISSFVLSNSIENYRNFSRFVEVKGLDEKIVKSNLASWQINFTLSNDDLKKIYSDLSFSQNTIIKFLLDQGFSENEIEKQAISVQDNHNSYDNKKGPRFFANSGINLSTNKVDLVNSVAQKTGALVESGIVINYSNIRYMFTELNSIKTEMLNKATTNAKDAAETFAKNSNSSIGKIKKASQGTISITAVNSNPNDMYSDEASIMKKVRVVTSIEFFIK